MWDLDPNIGRDPWIKCANLDAYTHMYACMYACIQINIGVYSWFKDNRVCTLGPIISWDLEKKKQKKVDDDWREAFYSMYVYAQIVEKKYTKETINARSSKINLK